MHHDPEDDDMDHHAFCLPLSGSDSSPACDRDGGVEKCKALFAIEIPKSIFIFIFEANVQHKLWHTCIGGFGCHVPLLVQTETIRPRKGDGHSVTIVVPAGKRSFVKLIVSLESQCNLFSSPLAKKARKERRTKTGTN